MSERVSIWLDGREFHTWEDFELSTGADTYSSVGFSAPFEFDRRDFRDTFRPTSYKPCDVRIDGDRVFSGELLGIEPTVSANERRVTVSAYSKPAKFLDVNPPASLLPLEYNRMDLRQIAQAVCEPFGIAVEFAGGEVGPRFERVRCEPDQGIQDFLVGLAKQRGFVVTDTPDGALLFWTSANAGAPVARLSEQPIESVTPTFEPRSYFSQLTGFASKKPGRKGGHYTEQNPRFGGASLRPLSFLLDDTETGDVPHAVRAKMGRMFGELCAFVVEGIPTWRTPHGRLWERNTTVRLKHPHAMIYRETEFLIRNVVLRANAGSRTAALGLVLPGALSGEPPPFLPWDEEP